MDAETATPPVAAVTGGASGIGLAFARKWLECGGQVVLMDYHEASLDAAVRERTCRDGADAVGMFPGPVGGVELPPLQCLDVLA